MPFRHGIERRVITVISGESMTKQAFAEETDINWIMRNYTARGVLESFNARPGRFGDFTGADDYLDAMVKVKEAEALFASLPAKVRDAVGNDPARLLAMAFDPAREDELRELGLLPPNEVAVPAVAGTGSPEAAAVAASAVKAAAAPAVKAPPGGAVAGGGE